MMRIEMKRTKEGDEVEAGVEIDGNQKPEVPLL